MLLVSPDCAVFLFCSSPSCLPCVASFSGLCFVFVLFFTVLCTLFTSLSGLCFFLFCFSPSCVPYATSFSRLCCVFALFLSVLSTICFPLLWIVLCFCFVFLRLVHPMLPVSLDCAVFLFCFSPSFLPYVTSFSGLCCVFALFLSILSILCYQFLCYPFFLDFPFGIL
jgi:hypothetical protein